MLIKHTDIKKPHKLDVYAAFFWRRGRDSNPRRIAPNLISNVLCDMESVRKEQKIMQEKLLYLQVKSELKAAKSGKKP